MKHNLKKMLKSETEGSRIRYLEALIKELQQLDLKKWCKEHGFWISDASVLRTFLEHEILGENQHGSR